MSSNFILINGFDRSGTTAITRLLAMHQNVELIMHPFNSGFIRKKMYEILDETDKEGPEHIFFSDLANNKLNNDLINSHWHDKYSTTKQYQAGKLHIVKTTINHFAQKWMVDHYSEIDVWGIWRDPKEIVNSIVRNGFYDEWYNDAIKQIIPTVKTAPILQKIFGRYITDLNTIAKKTAFLIAVRNYFFFKYLVPERVLNYEIFKNDANYLNKFINNYNYSAYDFSKKASEDLNIVGNYNKQKKEVVYTEAEVAFFDQIFLPLKQMVKERHNIA